MGLRQEVMDFAATYKALAPTSQDQYYDELVKEAKRKRKEAEEMDAIDKAAVDERRRQVEGGTFDRSGRVTAIPSPFGAVPPKVRTAPVETAPPITSTFATAFDTGWPQARRGGVIRGRMKRYAAGGDVTNPGRDDDEVAQNDADLIVQQFLGPKGTAAQRINRQVDEPWTVPGPVSEIETRGMRDKAQNAADLAAVQAREGQALQTSAPPVEPKSRLRRALDVVDKAVAPDPFAVGEGRARRKARLEARQVEPGLTEELTDEEYRRREAEAARLRGEIGASAKRQQDEALSGLPPLSDLPSLPPGTQVDAEGNPLGPVRQPDGTYVPGANKEGPVLPPQGSADPPRTAPPALRPSSDPRVATGDVDPATALRPTSPYPAVALPNAPAGVPDKRSTQYGPGTEAPSPAVTPPATTPPVATVPAKPSATAGASGPQGGTGGSAAPPPGAASANAPSSARKEDPRTRTAAFEPGRERIDPATGATQARDIDARGNVVYPSPQEMRQVVAGATTAAPSRGGEVVGNGAVSRENLRAFTDAHNPGGRFTKGQALMVGMTSRYKQLLAKGRVKEAAAMAWGLIQAANLEAASFGEVAKDQIRRGDLTGATQSLVQGLDYAPDGMGHRAVPGGIETYDPRTGQVTARTKVDGKTALQIALGMSDGSMLWEALQKASAQVAPPDKDAQGRALRDELTRLRIAREQQRLAGGGGGGGGGRGGGRGAKAPVAKTAEEQELDKIYGAPPA